MRRKAAPALVLLIAFAVSTATATIGCGHTRGKTQPGADDQTGDDGAPAHQIVFATGEISGAYYRVGAVLASLWSKEVRDTEVVTRPTGGAMANLKMLANAEADIALAASNTALRAYDGAPPFQAPVGQLRAIAALYPEVFHFVARRNSGLRLVSDIRGLRVAVGSKLGGTHLTTRELLEAHGVSAGEIRTEYLSFSEAVFAMQAGMVDVAVVGAGVPAPAVQDAAAMTDIRLLSVDPGKTDRFLSGQPYIGYQPIPSGTYGGVEEEVLTIGSPALLVTTTGASEELIYRFTSTLFSSREILSGIPQLKLIDLSFATKRVSIPFHEGALRYYKEVGAIR